MESIRKTLIIKITLIVMLDAMVHRFYRCCKGYLFEIRQKIKH